MLWQTVAYQALAFLTFLWIVFLPFETPDPSLFSLAEGGV